MLLHNVWILWGEVTYYSLPGVKESMTSVMTECVRIHSLPSEHGSNMPEMKPTGSVKLLR